MEINSRDGVFKGLKILAFCWAVVGPLTMKFFADHGATVIRVETSRRPCTMRSSAPYKDNVPDYNKGGYFNYYNSNVLSLGLNMQLPEAREIARRLAVECDIFMENFTPGVIEKWGLSYEELKEIRPDIIMLRQNGYGSWGPYANLPAFGMVLVPIAGPPNYIGWPDKEPLPVGVSAYTDSISPRFATATLIAALSHREKTGKGQYIDISMTDGVVGLLTLQLYLQQRDGKFPERGNTLLAHRYACYNTYETKDGRCISVGAVENRFWKQLCENLKVPEYTPLQYDDVRRKEILGFMRKTFKQKTLTEWEEILSDIDTCWAPVQTMEEVLKDPIFREREMVLEKKGEDGKHSVVLGVPIKLSETPGAVRSYPVSFGKNTKEILKELGYFEDKIVDFEEKGII